MNRFSPEWIDRLRKGEEEAFAFFYRLYASPLWAHLLKMLGNEETAQEILQETFVLVVRKLDFYEPRQGTENGFRSWVYRIATNRAIDEIRKRKKQAQLNQNEEAAQNNDPFILVEHSSTAKMVERLVGQLPAKQRTFLHLKVVEEMNYKEIADICGCNVNAVKQGIFRARTNLKELLEKEGALI